jgi:hypothetical protein
MYQLKKILLIVLPSMVEAETFQTTHVTTSVYATPRLEPQVLCKVKVKVTLVQALRLCTGHTAHWGSRGIALLYRH